MRETSTKNDFRIAVLDRQRTYPATFVGDKFYLIQ